MLNPLNFLSKFIKSSNQKELDQFQKIVDQIKFNGDGLVSAMIFQKECKC